MREDLRLADLLAALSVATDLGMGQEPEKAVRGCLVATSLARAMDLPEAEVGEVFWTTLLQHVGCTAPAQEFAYLFGDDLTVSVRAERTDSASLRETLALLAAAGRGAGVHRARHLARTLAAGQSGSRTIARAVCEVGALMAERLDDVARAFADMVDLLTPFTLGHSAGVARLAGEAAGLLRLPGGDADLLRRAALLHDLGRVAISGGVWEKPGPLTSTQWEQVRLHPYHTERILSRSTALEPLARVAGMHHERQDGSGYHHGASGAEVPALARLLAAADAYQAMTQDRPHRAALAPEAAARELEAATRAGRHDPECARAVLQAAGQRPSRSRTRGRRASRTGRWRCCA